MPRYEFVTNIYQAFGLSIISVLSQDVPRVRFFPPSAQAEEDVSAAKAATEVAGLVEHNNRIGNLIVEEAFNLWTDGKVGAYVRFVVDGQRFRISSRDRNRHAPSENRRRRVRLPRLRRRRAESSSARRYQTTLLGTNAARCSPKKTSSRRK